MGGESFVVTIIWIAYNFGLRGSSSHNHLYDSAMQNFTTALSIGRIVIGSDFMQLMSQLPPALFFWGLHLFFGGLSDRSIVLGWFQFEIVLFGDGFLLGIFVVSTRLQ